MYLAGMAFGRRVNIDEGWALSGGPYIPWVLELHSFTIDTFPSYVDVGM